MNLELGNRESLILNILAEKGSLSVTSLARELDVSEVTIRSDLKNLEAKGFLNRTRGGAQSSFSRDILERQRLNIEEKSRIAKAAAEFVHDGDTIMIEAGTTTALIIRYLTGKRGVQIVTNSTLVFSNARLNPALSIILTGGIFRKETESLVGPVALKAISEFNVRYAFVGTDGFSIERGLTTQLVEGAEIVKAMKGRAEETWLVADSSKYGKTGFVSVLPLGEVNGIITDTRIDESALRVMSEVNLQVRRV
ncbi:MAG: DeoR/GlpR family DNA-binding transcription regulator [Spirochaetaceae bacterium]|nr:DeoR/GlpR family DNA-binding transcription regulator [Spirochaetaceae bacterium]